MRYHVRWGASAEISQVVDRAHWQAWTTRIPLTFDEPYSRSGYKVTFRRGRWLLRVHQDDVLIYDGCGFIPLNAFDKRGRKPRR